MAADRFEKKRAAFAARVGFSAESPRLIHALTHASAANDTIISNERLEFLGDALLSAIVALILFNELPAQTDEGTLTRARAGLVRRETLAAAARRLTLSEVLLVSDAERQNGRHEQSGLLADAYEAVLAAVFLEQGMASAERFVRETLLSELAEIRETLPAADPKTALQEHFQRLGQPLPVYELISQEGAGPETQFCVAVFVNGARLGQGTGPSKRAASRIAALRALEQLSLTADGAPAAETG